MSKSKYSPEVRERAVRMVSEHRADYPSQWAAIQSIAAKIGCTPQTLDNWVKKVSSTQPESPPALSDAVHIRELERENRELKKANEILKLASAFFAQAEVDRHTK